MILLSRCAHTLCGSQSCTGSSCAVIEGMGALDIQWMSAQRGPERSGDTKSLL
ncbi:hypothetical protein [Sporofaciens musculi]|uniref:hypothetical protein n=1 Tax=Sporofaciens musculi TaxID=2681861 RepID=UPI00256FBD9D|nr:hypothetical protein [Sporofaciens musculi]